jgi:hypothetical protein
MRCGGGTVGLAGGAINRISQRAEIRSGHIGVGRLVLPFPMAEEALDGRVTGRCRHGKVDASIL